MLCLCSLGVGGGCHTFVKSSQALAVLVSWGGRGPAAGHHLAGDELVFAVALPLALGRLDDRLVAHHLHTGRLLPARSACSHSTGGSQKACSRTSLPSACMHAAWPATLESTR